MSPDLQQAIQLLLSADAPWDMIVFLRRLALFSEVYVNEVIAMTGLDANTRFNQLMDTYDALESEEKELMEDSSMVYSQVLLSNNPRPFAIYCLANTPHPVSVH